MRKDSASRTLNNEITELHERCLKIYHNSKILLFDVLFIKYIPVQKLYAIFKAYMYKVVKGFLPKIFPRYISIPATTKPEFEFKLTVQYSWSKACLQWNKKYILSRTTYQEFRSSIFQRIEIT